jgi:hypothetical protein
MGPPPIAGEPDFEVCLIVRMERERLEPETDDPSLGRTPCARKADEDRRRKS